MWTDECSHVIEAPPPPGLFASLTTFFCAPQDRASPEQVVSRQLRLLLRLLLLDLAFALVTGLLINLFDKPGWLEMDRHAVSDAFAQLSSWQLLLVAGVAAPLVEEFVFRLPLRYESNLLMGLFRWLTPDTTPEIAATLAAQRRADWDRYYPWTFYGLTFIFALVHLFNYPTLSRAALLLSPLLIAPQFFLGALAGFLRVREGLIWAILLHSLHNLLLVSIALLAPDGGMR